MQDMDKMWLEGVFRPCLKYLDAVEDASAIRGEADDVYVPGPLVAEARNGASVPMLEIPTHDCGYVTITLREKDDFTASRNSNMEAWVKCAESLGKDGISTIVVRDTSKAFDKLAGLQTCPEASLDMDRRIVLYRDATMNFFVENGPAALCVFSKMPWMQFWSVDGSERLRSPDVVQKDFGLQVGDQYPWSEQNQRIIWKADSYDNIAEAWDQVRS